MAVGRESKASSDEKKRENAAYHGLGYYHRSPHSTTVSSRAEIVRL